MYIHQEKKPKRTSAFRVFILTILILCGLWLIRVQPEWARPFEPSPIPTRAARYFINDGDIFFGEGKLYQAIDAYEQAIQLEPENDIPYSRQSNLLIFTGDTARALTKAEKAVILNPESAENLAGYCHALDWEGQYADAYDACECAIDLDPAYAPGYAYLSEIYADQGYWAKAKTVAQQALEVDFQSPEAHYDMAYALEVQGRYAEAIEFYKNAITLRPKLAFYYSAAGQNYYWLGKMEEAAKMFGEAIKLNPTDSRNYDQIGWAFHSNGEDSRAIDALEQAISVDQANYRAWGRLGSIYYFRQNYEEAIKLLPTAIDLAEHQFLLKARKIEILTQIQGAAGPEAITMITGRFEQSGSGNATTLIAPLAPVQWAKKAIQNEVAQTCGHSIANTLKNRIVLISPIQDISFSQAFSNTTGTASLNIATGELTVALNHLPRPQEIPYEVRLQYQSEETVSLGYIQPDANNQTHDKFVIASQLTGPVEYYYELGLSYAYLSPPQCAEAVPWLLKALEKENVYYNPAWEGLKICPSEDSPPTPLPTFTPLPEETTN